MTIVRYWQFILYWGHKKKYHGWWGWLCL